jgi:hypothetical protein
LAAALGSQRLTAWALTLTLEDSYFNFVRLENGAGGRFRCCLQPVYIRGR